MQRLIDEIRETLGRGVSGRPAEVVAWEYAEACREVNGRLDRVVGMLDAGGEIEALQAAEQSPRLVDRVQVLAFGDEGAWQDFCGDHGHEVAPALDARLTDRLLALYDKGLAANHPLYRDYRSAMLSKDEARALELVRIIASLNPADANAQRELARLGKKGCLRALGALGAALSAEDGEGVLRLMAKVEEGREEDYEKHPEWLRGCRWRDERRRSEAFHRQAELVAQAGSSLEAGDWRGAAVFLAEHGALAAVHGVAGDPELEARLRRAGEGVDSARRETERLAAVRGLVKQLEHLADEVETRGVTPEGLSAEFAVANLQSIAGKAREMEALRGEAPAGLKTRLGAVRERLESVVARRRRRKRLGWGSAVGLVSLVLLGLAAYGWITTTADRYRSGLVEAREAGGSVAVRKLLDEVAGQAVWIKGLPPLAAEAGVAEAWLAEVGGRRDLVARELARLERDRDVNFEGVESARIIKQVEELSGTVAGLPADLRMEQEARLLVVKNEMERMLQARQRDAQQTAGGVMDHWEGVLGRIDRSAPAAVAAASLEGWAEALAPLKELQGNEDELLKLPAASGSRFVDLDQRLTAVGTEVTAVRRQLEAFAAAADRTALVEVLGQLGRGGFAEAGMAQAVVDAWPGDEQALAEMLFAGDLVAYKAATAELRFLLPMPQSAAAGDRAVVTNLRAHKAFKDVWLLEWKKRGESQRGFSLGQLVSTADGSKHRGSIATPPLPGGEPFFVEGRLDSFTEEKLVSNVESPASALLRRLRLDELLDDSGTRFKRSVIPLIDEVMAADDAPALARAFLLGRLFEMVAGREMEWGVPLSPRLARDLKEVGERLAQEPVGGGDWMSAAGAARISAGWQEYFGARKAWRYGAEIEARMKVLRNASKVPPVLVARLDGERRVIAGPTLERRLVWGIREDAAGGMKFRFAGTLEPGGELKLVSGGALAPLSPLISIEIPEEALALIVPELGISQTDSGGGGR